MTALLNALGRTTASGKTSGQSHLNAKHPNDDIGDTDASGWNMQAGRIHLTVGGVSYPDAGKRVQDLILRGAET